MKRNIIYLFLSAVLVFSVSAAFAQDVAVTPDPSKIDGSATKARPSPMAVATMKKGDAYVKVVYGQPQLKGRNMIGGTEAYGKVWRLGANEATEITTTKDIMVGDETLAAGTYSMFAVPEKDKWTIIFNSGLGQWGAYSYDESKDVLRVDVPVEKAEKTFESFTIWFSADGSTMHMAWGETQISVPVQVTAS